MSDEIRKIPLYQLLAQKIGAYHRCVNRGAGQDHLAEWETRHREAIESLCSNYLPSGSGFDCGTKLDFDASTENKLVFMTEFHHMNDVGMYDGWSDHSVIVKPSLSNGFYMRITGRDRNGWKDYAYEAFDVALREPIAFDA